METAEALMIVRSLADGVDPQNGETFDAQSVYQRAQTVRALQVAAQALEAADRAGRRKMQLPAKTGDPWSEEEDRSLLAAFDAGGSLDDLSATHQRTRAGIRARLLKYGRLAA